MRTPSHITKFDDHLHGGFIKPSAVLIAGSCGSGKTNLCMQSLFNAAKQGERCAYVSMLSESQDKVTRSLSAFSFYDKEQIKNNLNIYSISSDVVAKGDFAIFEYLNENVLKKKPSRVVIDTINILEDIESTFDERPFYKCELRSFIQNLLQEFDENDILLMATCEIPATDIHSSLWPYMFDTVVLLGTENGEQRPYRYMEIIKERGSDFTMGKHRFNITDDGIVL
ncbi:RAD55 family ATPase [Methanolobus profundi]|uniref:Circadian clock protein KaiC n=1 Tax=Methanolobus profundi TaxID=487685 RepID=A0A1I4Q274_9EURY|nr:ATPase domain-containing protein [Methanolobus profundi]SFM33760.1 circadian clock protein KaiC [Methanolobus profundi]